MTINVYRALQRFITLQTFIIMSTIMNHMQLSDLVRYIWMVFGEQKLSSKEVETRLAELFNYHCPDAFIKTMTKLKMVGLVKGEFSVDKGTWLWWVDDECKSLDPKEVLSADTIHSDACKR